MSRRQYRARHVQGTALHAAPAIPPAEWIARAGPRAAGGSHLLETALPSVALQSSDNDGEYAMQQVTEGLRSDAATRLKAVRDASRWAGESVDDARRYMYTEGWDKDDAELGWVDLEVVSGSRRPH